MPSTSQKQHNLMAGVAKSPSFAKKVGIDRSVGEEYLKADRKNAAFMAGSGGGKQAAINKQNTNHGKMDMPYASLNKLAGKASGGQIMKGSARTRKFAKGGSLERVAPEQSFGSAFKEARGAGVGTFTWRGKKYTTDMAPAAKVPAKESSDDARDVMSRKKVSNDDTRDVMARKAPSGEGLSDVGSMMNYAKGGKVMKSESKSMMKKEVDFFKKKGAPKSMIKHEQAEMKTAKFAKGGGIESRGKTKGKMC